jgi:hypothetical protein
MKAKWLAPDLVGNPLKVAVCMTEKQYMKVMKQMNITDIPKWVADGKDATVHHFEGKPERDYVTVFCMRVRDETTVVEFAGLVVHECVHIWQEICERLGESHPSREFEAYSIQWLTQQVMWAALELQGYRT